MQPSNSHLPKSVCPISTDDKTIYLVGTAHVSKESVEDVHVSINTIQPEAICVELCAARYKAMVERDAWMRMDIFKVIKERKAAFLLAQLIMNSFYRRIGQQLGVEPGAEMKAAIQDAKKTGAELVLADRDIEITLKRVWGYVGFWNKMKMMSSILGSFFISEKIDEKLIQNLKSQDQLGTIMETFTKALPEVKKRLIDERDIYLATKIRNAPGKTVVAVVGAGHVPGIQQHVKNDASLEPLLEVPPRSILPSLLKWMIPIAIIVLLIWGFFKGGTQHAMESVYIWILVNGILAAIGAALALAHPLTILASFLGAPLTSLNPMIAAGWVAGLVQAWVRKPTVTDLENLPHAIQTVKGFWMNPASRILLVVVLANLGSALGTFISGSWIAARSF
jgi:pheromone shutdown-related protein TraB